MIKIGAHPVCKKFIISLPKFAKGQVDHSLRLLRTYGYELRMPQSKKIDSNLYELRVRGALPVRLLYCFINQNAYLLHGFIKKSNQIPKKELLTVKKRLRFLTFI